jgi:hypothetical protein
MSSSAATVGPVSADIMSHRVKRLCDCTIHSRNGSKSRAVHRSQFSKARRLAEKQHIEAFGAGRLVIRAWYFYCNPRVIIDKARLAQMTLERFLIFQYRFAERRSPVYVVPPSTGESRMDSNALSSIEQMKKKKSSSSLKLNEMKALFIVTASFDI